MIINIDTQQPLSESDRAALRALIGSDAAPGTIESDEPAVAAAVPAKKAAAPAKKAAAKKAAPAPDPEPEPEEDENEALRDKALAIAKGLLASGEREKVTEALEAVGAPKVSDVEDGSLQDFIDALEA